METGDARAVGDVGGGWDVAMTTLLHERGTLGFALVARLEVQVRKLLALAADRGATPVQREAIAREIPGARLLVLEDAATAIPDEAAGEVAEAMLALG